MPGFPVTPQDMQALQGVRTMSVHDRQHKVRAKDFVTPQAWRSSGSLRALFPRLLKGLDITDIVDGFVTAHQRERAVMLAMGAHVIKCGLSPVLIDMLQRGWLTSLVLNGAGVIHDVEVALIGETSEDVAQGLDAGDFGMVEETPRLVNEAMKAHDADRLGMGAAVGKAISEGQYPYKAHSLLAAAYSCGVPVTVHVAIGADTIHMHPSTDGALLGAATYRDFQKLSILLRDLHDGGCYWNVGSAVILPEVFLKALTLCRNTGHEVKRFMTVNLDMLQHYRTDANVVRRPTQEGGRGYTLTGHHEIMVPLLYAMLLQAMEGQ